MDVPVTGEAPLTDDGSFGGYTVVARALIDRYPDASVTFTRQLVHMWWLRRDRNELPPKYSVVVRSGKVKQLFRTSEIVNWYDNYRTNGSGRP